MIANEAVLLNKEIKRLRRFGIDAIVQPDGDKYNIRFKKSKEFIEPYCSSTEVLGIINSIEVILERIIKYGKYKDMDLDRNDLACNDSKGR